MVLEHEPGTPRASRAKGIPPWLASEQRVDGVHAGGLTLWSDDQKRCRNPRRNSHRNVAAAQSVSKSSVPKADQRPRTSD